MESRLFFVMKVCLVFFTGKTIEARKFVAGRGSHRRR
jgi:hypothetical protein